MLVLAMQFSKGIWAEPALSATMPPPANQRGQGWSAPSERNRGRNDLRLPRPGGKTYHWLCALEDPTNTCFNLGIPFHWMGRMNSLERR